MQLSGIRGLGVGVSARLRLPGSSHSGPHIRVRRAREANPGPQDTWVRGFGGERAVKSRSDWALEASGETGVVAGTVTTEVTVDDLETLENILNTRDIASGYAAVRPGVLYRSANPCGASSADISVLADQTGIRELIDLRAPEEIEDEALTAGASVTTHYRTRWSASLKSRDEVLPGQSAHGMHMHRIAPLNRERYYWALLQRLPIPLTIRCMLVGIVDGDMAQSFLINEVNRGGLPMLYTILLDTAGPELRRAMEVVLEAVEAEKPLMFYCKAGKDRTGLLAMLILGLMGASREDIVADYHISDKHKKVALGGIEEKHGAKAKGLDWKTFSGAPRHAMEAALDHIESKYGDVPSYLTRIGFGPEEQTRLVLALSSKRD